MEDLLKRVAALEAYIEARKTQQLFDPFDDTSRLILRALTDGGTGSHSLTQSINVASTPQSITVPAAFTGTFIVNSANGPVEVPYY